jgi:hypothetical protein
MLRFLVCLTGPHQLLRHRGAKGQMTALAVGAKRDPVLRFIFYSMSYLLTYGSEPFLRSRQLCSHSRTSQHFMEPEGSLPCSQEPSTDPYPEPHQSNSHHPILSKIQFNIVHQPTYSMS